MNGSLASLPSAIRKECENTTESAAIRRSASKLLRRLTMSDLAITGAIARLLSWAAGRLQDNAEIAELLPANRLRYRRTVCSLSTSVGRGVCRDLGVTGRSAGDSRLATGLRHGDRARRRQLCDQLVVMEMRGARHCIDPQ